MFWEIGKNVFYQRKVVANAVEKYSIYYQYKYGITESFSRTQIKAMELFYLAFPVFYDQLLLLTWQQYLELIYISDCYERYFYFRLLIFSHGSIFELQESLANFYYQRI